MSEFKIIYEELRFGGLSCYYHGNSIEKWNIESNKLTYNIVSGCSKCKHYINNFDRLKTCILKNNISFNIFKIEKYEKEYLKEHKIKKCFEIIFEKKYFP